MTVMVVPVSTVRSFIEEYHYSKNINGCKVSICFALYHFDDLVGAMLFGAISTGAWKKYGELESDVVELRRLVCLDECPKNTESWFIAKALKVLKKVCGYKICVSYADPYHDHIGVIYQASNWNYQGTTQPDIMLEAPDGKIYHSRALNVKYKGDYKPFAKRLRALYDEGKLKKIKVPGKYIYTYSLVGTQPPTQIPYPKVNVCPE